ncbi:ion transporter [candidate division TA06 bacterium]|uniref:Ion transporter n=1 Tax=candidate division TA06 bacterium TaxID=2250710 RepID=A0A523UZ36_UNCT6|nr:MAG: ion transporter [candidate division TA06 bacterium]
MICDKLTFRRQKWNRVVDVATLVWLGVFVAGFLVKGRATQVCGYVNIALLGVFVADLGVIYKTSENWRRFIKQHWLDILMVIPYLRVFRIFRIFRLARFLRIAKVAKTRRAFKVVKAVKAGRSLKTTKLAKAATKSRQLTKLGRIKKAITVGHESGDLPRSIKERISPIKQQEGL